MPAVRLSTAQTERYGAPGRGRQLIPGEALTISLARSGMDVSVAPSDLAEGKSPDLVDVRVALGRVSSAYDVASLGTAFSGGVGTDEILHLREYQTKTLTDRLVRMRPTGWDSWDGSIWTTLPGTALTGLVSERIYSAAMENKLLGTNGVDRIKSWSGGLADSVVDLSADAPICKFIAPMDNRLVAARVKDGSDIDPYKVSWSADGEITEWTDANKGAGSVLLEPEGSAGLPDFIQGLSAHETALVIYRERSIALGLRTGIGAAPFVFTTGIVGIGTKAPYSIANGGLAGGDFFLGHDLNVYHFAGTNAPPVPVGGPIWPLLRERVNDSGNTVGVIDLIEQEYWLAIATGVTDVLNEAWIFNIAAWLRSGKRELNWTRRTLADYRTIGFGRTSPGNDPTVNSVSSIVNTIGDRVNAFESGVVLRRMLFGDDAGQVFNQDLSAWVAGSWKSQQFGNSRRSLTISRVTITAESSATASVETSVSIDGGSSWTVPKTFTIAPTTYAKTFTTYHNVTGLRPQVRIRILSGQVSISAIDLDIQQRDRPITAS